MTEVQDMVNWPSRTRFEEKPDIQICNDNDNRTDERGSDRISYDDVDNDVYDTYDDDDSDDSDSDNDEEIRHTLSRYRRSSTQQEVPPSPCSAPNRDPSRAFRQDFKPLSPALQRFRNAARRVMEEKLKESEEGVSIRAISLRARQRFQTAFLNLEQTGEREFLSGVLHSLPLMIRETGYISDVRASIFEVFDGEESPENCVGCITTVLHELKMVTARYCWSEFICPAQEAKALIEEQHRKLKEQFSSARGSYLQEVTTLRDQNRVRVDPETYLRRLNGEEDEEQRDRRQFFEPTHSLSDEEMEYCARVVREKLTMILDTSQEGRVNLAQIRAMEEQLQNRQADQLRQIVARQEKEIQALQDELKSFKSAVGEKLRRGKHEAELQTKNREIMMLEEKVEQLRTYLKEQMPEVERIELLEKERREFKEAYEGEVVERVALQEEVSLLRAQLEALGEKEEMLKGEADAAKEQADKLAEQVTTLAKEKDKVRRTANLTSLASAAVARRTATAQQPQEATSSPSMFGPEESIASGEASPTSQASRGLSIVGNRNAVRSNMESSPAPIRSVRSHVSSATVVPDVSGKQANSLEDDTTAALLLAQEELNAERSLRSQAQRQMRESNTAYEQARQECANLGKVIETKEEKIRQLQAALALAEAAAESASATAENPDCPELTIPTVVIGSTKASQKSRPGTARGQSSRDSTSPKSQRGSLSKTKGAAARKALMMQQSPTASPRGGNTSLVDGLLSDQEGGQATGGEKEERGQAEPEVTHCFSDSTTADSSTPPPRTSDGGPQRCSCGNSDLAKARAKHARALANKAKVALKRLYEESQKSSAELVALQQSSWDHRSSPQRFKLLQLKVREQALANFSQELRLDFFSWLERAEEERAGDTINIPGTSAKVEQDADALMTTVLGHFEAFVDKVDHQTVMSDQMHQAKELAESHQSTAKDIRRSRAFDVDEILNESVQKLEETAAEQESVFLMLSQKLVKAHKAFVRREANAIASFSEETILPNLEKLLKQEMAQEAAPAPFQQEDMTRKGTNRRKEMLARKRKSLGQMPQELTLDSNFDGGIGGIGGGLGSAAGGGAGAEKGWSHTKSEAIRRGSAMAGGPVPSFTRSVTEDLGLLAGRARPGTGAGERGGGGGSGGGGGGGGGGGAPGGSLSARCSTREGRPQAAGPAATPLLPTISGHMMSSEMTSSQTSEITDAFPSPRALKSEGRRSLAGPGAAASLGAVPTVVGSSAAGVVGAASPAAAAGPVGHHPSPSKRGSLTKMHSTVGAPFRTLTGSDDRFDMAAGLGIQGHSGNPAGMMGVTVTGMGGGNSGGSGGGGGGGKESSEKDHPERRGSKSKKEKDKDAAHDAADQPRLSLKDGWIAQTSNEQLEDSEDHGSNPEQPLDFSAALTIGNALPMSTRPTIPTSTRPQYQRRMTAAALEGSRPSTSNAGGDFPSGLSGSGFANLVSPTSPAARKRRASVT